MKKIEKPWGHEIIWAESSGDSGYIGKILFIKAGSRLSMQYHEVKEETIYVKSGILYLETLGSIKTNIDLHKLKNKETKIKKLFPGDVIHVRPFETHRFMANEGHVELFEVSTKELDDVVRIFDDYGRV